MLNDEIIGAYLDGELTPARRAEIELALQQNNGAAARLERMRMADDVLREAVGAAEEKRAKDPLAELILSDWPAKVRPALTNRTWVNHTWALRAAALAAACVLGVLAGNISAPQGLVRPDMRVSAALAGILDDAPSGGARTANGSRVEVALSFRTDAGALCRQFRATSGAVAADAVACRGEDGWRMLVQAAVNEGEGYRTASAADPIAAAVESMGGVSVLTVGEEHALIGAGWRE